MIVFIKGEPESGMSPFARRLVERLDLDPVVWDIPEDLLRRAQSRMGGWLDLSDEYFGSCHHVDMDRVVAWLQIEKWDELPTAPTWRPDADREEMQAWRRRVMKEICDGRLLPELFRLTSRLLAAQRQSVIEGAVLGTRFADSRLAKMLRSRFLDRAQLHIALSRRRVRGDTGEVVATINGHTLGLDEAIRVLSRRTDGAIVVNPDVGWTWGGKRVGAGPPTGVPSPLAEERSER
jgi:hypothetical protein